MKNNKISGFVLLREATGSCGGQSHNVQEYRHEKTGIEFVFIPAGIFLMGSNDKGNNQEWPQHKVSLDAFLIAKYTLRQREWEKVMGSNPSFFKGPDHPVESVSLNDCLDFCKKTGLSVPTEAQWEYACRAGTTTNAYWGEDKEYKHVGKYCWYKDNSGEISHPVGEKLPNAYGLYDMLGNVWQWCRDVYESYPNKELKNPVAPFGLVASRFYDRHVRRGACWNSKNWMCHSSFRGDCEPMSRLKFNGFRPVFPLTA